MPHLFLSRRVGEYIKIGDDIVITVDQIRGHAARFSVRAPAGVPITRGELLIKGEHPRGIEQRAERKSIFDRKTNP